MAEAQVWVRILALVLAGCLGLPGLALGQASVVVDERPIPPSPTGELGEADIARAVAMIRDLGTTFGALSARLDGAGIGADWQLYRDIYHRAADRLDALRAEGNIEVGDLSTGRATEGAGGGMVLDSTLGGHWDPDEVRADRRLGGSDWAAISRLAGVLIEQLASQEQTPDWTAWADAHDSTARLRELAGEAPGPLLQPLLLRFWHIQDKYVANALSAAGTVRTVGQLGRAAALSNEMLGILRQAEDVAGWRWRQPLETVWRESVERTSALAGTLAPPRPAAAAGPVAEADAQPPRSADFDELFPGAEPAPQVTAAGPGVDDLRADIEILRGETVGLRADVEAFGGDNQSLRTDVESLRGDTEQLHGDVEMLDGDTKLLRTDVDRLRGDAEQLRGDVAGLGSDAKSLRTEVEGLHGDAEQLRGSVEMLAGEANAMRGAVQTLDGDAKSVRAEVEVLRGETGSLRTNFEKLGTQTSTLRAEAQVLGGDIQSLRANVETLGNETKSMRAEAAIVDQDNAARAQALRSLQADLARQSLQIEALTASLSEQGRRLAVLAEDAASARLDPAALQALAARQAALEERVAGLNREVGPEGLPKQLAELQAAMGTEQDRARDAAQRLETRLQDRLRDLGREIEATQQQIKAMQSGLSAARPSRTAVTVSLRDEAARKVAFHQTVVAGAVLFALFVAAIVFWVRAARQRAMAHEGPDVPPEAPGAAQDIVLGEALAQLRGAVDAERNRAGAMAERLARVTASLTESQARGRRLEADLAAVRTATRTMGRGLLDGAARDQAMGAELTQLRQAVEAERARSAALQSRIDEIKASAASSAVGTTPPLNGAGHTAPAARPTPPRRPAPGEVPGKGQGEVPGDFVADMALRRRAIEALHRGDLAGFERTFAELTALPLPMIEDMVGEPSGHDLALACRVAEIAKPHFAAILILSRRSRSGASQPAPRQLAQAIAHFDETSKEDAAKALRAWQSRAPARERWANGLT